MQPILENIELLARIRANPRVEIIDGKYKYKVGDDSCAGMCVCAATVVNQTVLTLMLAA